MTMTETDWGQRLADALASLDSTVKTRDIADAALNLHDGMITGRIVPYDKPALVLDKLPDGRPDIYNEGFRRGAFDRLLRDPKANAGRIEFKHRHDGGLGYLGPGVDLEERDDGMYATFRIVPGHRANVADLLDGGHRGLSIEFRDVPDTTVIENEKTPEEIRWRTDVLLRGVALELQGAYTEAQVLAYRSEVTDADREQVAQEQADREQKQADAAAAQAVADREAQVAEAKRKQAEVDAWLAEQETKQAELAAKYK